MKHLGRKEALIQKLSGLEDEGLLSLIETIVDSYSSDQYRSWEDLPNQVREDIHRGIEEMNRGEGFSHWEVMKEARDKLRKEDEA